MQKLILCIIGLGFPGGTVVKNLPANVEGKGLIPGFGRSPGGVNGNPLQHSCLKNPMDRGAWWATVHEIAANWTRLSNWAHHRPKENLSRQIFLRQDTHTPHKNKQTNKQKPQQLPFTIRKKKLLWKQKGKLYTGTKYSHNILYLTKDLYPKYIKNPFNLIISRPVGWRFG